MDYIIDPISTIAALSVMGLAISAKCTAETHEDCLLCPKERQCAFINATITTIEKGEGYQ